MIQTARGLPTDWAVWIEFPYGQIRIEPLAYVPRSMLQIVASPAIGRITYDYRPAAP